MLGYRSNDAVLTICQNNSSKSIEIIDANEAAAAMLGYAAGEIKGKTLGQMIPERLGTLLIEYVEFEADANDVGMVLSKTPTFSMLSKDKKEKNFRLKVVRGESTKDQLTFRLVLQDAVDARKGDALHKFIQENFKGHEVLHPQFGIPDRKSIEKDIELIMHYHSKAQLRASFVLVQVDHFDAFAKQYDEAQCTAFLKHIIQVCRGNLRPTDVIGAVGDTHFGVLLFDSVSDSTRMVANRLRWQVAAHPFMLGKTPLNLSASMVYINIDSSITADKVLPTCEAALAALPDGTASHLSEAA